VISPTFSYLSSLYLSKITFKFGLEFIFKKTESEKSSSAIKLIKNIPPPPG
jgi:hypothetical protein